MLLAVGKDLFALCGKCEGTWHVIVSMDGAKVTRVQCKQCMGYHRYRPAPGEENVNKPARQTIAAKTGTSKTTTKAGTKAANGRKTATPRKPTRSEEPLVAADLSRPIRGYTMKETYTPGDRIEHPKFGEGVVESSPSPGKVNVFFVDGRRTLAQGHADKPLA